jgi:hypothetical protein
MEGPAPDIEHIEKEIKVWLGQNGHAGQSKQENAADILQTIQGGPSVASPISTNGSSSLQQSRHLPPVPPTISSHQASQFISSLDLPSTVSDEFAVEVTPVTEPGLIRPQANVKVARAARPLPDQVFPADNYRSPRQPNPLHQAQLPGDASSRLPASRPTPTPGRTPGYVSIALAPKLVARFTPLLRDFVRLFSLKEAWIERNYLRMKSHSTDDDPLVEVARRVLAILARCVFPDYETECPNFRLSDKDDRIWRRFRGPHIHQPVSNENALSVAELIKHEIDVPPQAVSDMQALSNNVGNAPESHAPYNDPSTQFNPSLRSTSDSHDSRLHNMAHSHVLSVLVPRPIMERVYHRSYDPEALADYFSLLSVDSVSYDKEGKHLLVFSDRSEHNIEFVRKVIAVLLRITEWRQEPNAKNMELGPIERSVRDGIMGQKDALRGSYTSERLKMLVRKMKEACELGRWQDEHLNLLNHVQRKEQHGLEDSGSWSHASEEKQHMQNSATVR